MRLIIHDLGKNDLLTKSLNSLEGTMVISDDGSIQHCIGCFGCWVKTPAACVIRDKYGDMGEYLSKSDELVIISECCYGGFSPFVKNVLDRSISYIHPYFIIKNGEMHHKRRYKNKIKLKVLFYGGNITDREKQTAERLVKANSINLHCKDYSVSFIENILGIEENLI